MTTRIILTVLILFLAGRAGTAQAQAPAAPETSTGTKVVIYPVLVWLPVFSATTTVPAFPELPDGPDLPGGAGSTSASLDAAFMAGVSVAGGHWRIDADGIWAALTSARERPLLDVDLHIIYGHVSGGVRVYKDLYVTGGVRRVALKYDIRLQDRVQVFSRKPGLWDPLVGLAWHSPLGSRLTLHVTGEGGGFGVGADADVSGSVRIDMEFGAHLGMTAGYGALYLKLSDTVRDRTFRVNQTMHGPIVGLGIYF